MATALSWLLGSVLMFIEFGVLGCSALGRSRRPGFSIRLGCASFAMSALAVGLAFAMSFAALPQRVFGLLWLGLLLAAVAIAPVLCYHASGAAEGWSDDDGDGGPGSDPSPPAGPPRGGVPLPDADQASTRRRDHNRPSLRDRSRQRRAPEPVRRRAPARPGHR